MQSFSGIQLHDTTGNGSQVAISMRGFGANASSNSLFLINEIPITNPDLAALDLNNIPLSQIQEIEIITNSESVLYGDQAVGGVINIVTEDKNLKDAITMSCEAGSYHFERCHVTLKKAQHALNYFFSLSNTVTNNYRDHNNYKQKLILGGGKYVAQNAQFSFNYQLANETMQYPGALTRTQVFQNRRQANNNINFFTDTNQSLFIKYEKNLNDNWQFNTIFSGRDMNGTGTLYSSFTQNRLSFFVKPQIKILWGNFLITNGIDFQQDQYYLKSLFGITNDRQQKYGLFTLGNYLLHSKWKMIAGLRVAQQISQLNDLSSNTKNINRAFVNTIGLTFNYSPSTHFYIRQAGSFRFPKAEENASTINGKGLNTQRGNAYETGIQWQNETQSIKLNFYQLNLRDEIAFDPTQTPQQPFGINVNLPPTSRQGFSFSTKRNIKAHIAIGGQYDYVNARFQNGPDATKRIPLVAENVLNTHIDYTINQYLNSYFEVIYTGSQYSANDNANIAGKIGGYSIFNMSLNFKHKELDIILRINNLFNKKYYLYTVYQLNQQFFYPAPERNILLTLQYHFV